MTPERERLIRDAWERIKRSGLQFDGYSDLRALNPEPIIRRRGLTSEFQPAEPIETDAFVFTRTFTDDRDLSGRRWWRVECEGIVVHGPCPVE